MWNVHLLLFAFLANDSKMIRFHASLQLECAECPSKFTERKNLNKHMKYHHAPMLPSYQCSACESKLLTSYGVREHMRDLHGINIDKASAEALNKPVKRRNKRK